MVLSDKEKKPIKDIAEKTGLSLSEIKIALDKLKIECEKASNQSERLKSELEKVIDNRKKINYFITKKKALRF